MSSNITNDQAKAIVTEIVTKALKKFRQELEGENEEFLDRTVRIHRDKIARISWLSAGKWCKFDDEGPVLMPDCTRIYYRKGKTEVLVQEFPPQVRIMKFRGSLAKRPNSSASISSSDANKQFLYSLSLPYTVFLFKFVDGIFREVKCVFSDRPLKRLEERPLRPYLSNLDSNLKVCLGQSFDSTQLIKGNIAQQAAFVLSHFWHSVYTDEWSSHYWSSKSHFETADPRLATLEAWQEASVDNPLFVIEDANWLKHTEESFGEMMVHMLEGDTHDFNFQEDLYNGISEECIKQIVETFNQSVEKADEKVSTSSIDQFADLLVSKLESL